jgi:hypothetical protein
MPTEDISQIPRFVRDLREMEARLTREVRVADGRAAVLAAGYMRRRAPQGPHQGGGALETIRTSVRAGGTMGRGTVTIGGARAPHALPTNFGGTIARYHSAKRTPVPAREFIYSGLTLARRDPRFPRVYAEAVDRAAKVAYPDRG